jgi:hypothetical protein
MQGVKALSIWLVTKANGRGNIQGDGAASDARLVSRPSLPAGRAKEMVRDIGQKPARYHQGRLEIITPRDYLRVVQFGMRVL